MMYKGSRNEEEVFTDRTDLKVEDEMELKAGDVIDIVGTDGSCEGCMYGSTGKCDVQCIGTNVKLVLRTGPKQGDTVWGRYCVGGRWFEGSFIDEYRGLFLVMSDMDEVMTFKEMTTTDPYALKYELTALEAINMMQLDNDVVGTEYAEGTKSRIVKGSICFVQRDGTVEKDDNFYLDQMYAIVEE